MGHRWRRLWVQLEAPKNRQSTLMAALFTGLVAPSHCQALNAPQEGLFELRLMNYQETQDGLERMQVKAQSSRFVLPVSEAVSAEMAQVVDAVSGASPLYYTEPSVFANVRDLRQAKDAKLSLHGERQRLSLGAASSKERDYQSLSHSIGYTWASQDQSLLLDLGFAFTSDLINPVNRVVKDARKTTQDRLIAATVVLTPRDLLQVQRTFAEGRGYFSDPYKFLDTRPDTRSTQAWVIRWHHHMPDWATSSRLSMRRLQDSFGIRSDTLQWELSKSLSERYIFTPGIRLYSQSMASFFSAPDLSQAELPRIPSDYVFGQSLLSFDQRLSQFGALNLSLQLQRKLGKGSVDLRIDHYRQKNIWSWHGKGSPGLADFSAITWQIGWKRPFSLGAH
jgi:hypothetical protein